MRSHPLRLSSSSSNTSWPVPSRPKFRPGKPCVLWWSAAGWPNTRSPNVPCLTSHNRKFHGHSLWSSANFKTSKFSIQSPDRFHGRWANPVASIFVHAWHGTPRHCRKSRRLYVYARSSAILPHCCASHIYHTPHGHQQQRERETIHLGEAPNTAMGRTSPRTVPWVFVLQILAESHADWPSHL